MLSKQEQLTLRLGPTRHACVVISDCRCDHKANATHSESFLVLILINQPNNLTRAGCSAHTLFVCASSAPASINSLGNAQSPWSIKKSVGCSRKKRNSWSPVSICQEPEGTSEPWAWGSLRLGPLLSVPPALAPCLQTSRGCAFLIYYVSLDGNLYTSQ